MSKLFKVIALCTACVFLLSSTPYADTISVPIPIGATIAATHSLAVQVLNYADDMLAASVSFPSPGATTWTVSDQYLRVIYSSNYPLWAIRIVTDNVTAYAGMYGKPIDPGRNGVYNGSPEAVPGSDDECSYGGLIDDATKTNPDNRAALAWQIFASKVAPNTLNDDALRGRTAAGAPTDAYNWNSPWAYVVDISNTREDTRPGAVPPYLRPIFIGVDEDGDTNTIEYSHFILGGGATSGLSFHPALGADPTNPDPKPGDGDVVAYLGARFGGLSGGVYGANLKVELIHE